MTMDRLWAGWRSEYIDDVTSDDGPRTSVFKRILESGLPDEETHIVWRGPADLRDPQPLPVHQRPRAGDALPRGRDLEALTPREHTELWATVTDAVRAIKTAYNADGLNIGVNLGRAGGAGVPDHLHVHVMPRWNADSNFMTSVAETRVLPEALPVTWRKLVDAWPS